MLPLSFFVIWLKMSYHVTIGIKYDKIAPVSDTVEQLTGTTREGHESLYLGQYDLFLLPEKMMIKYNFVWGEDEWDYSEYKAFPVLLVVESTERPDYIVSLAEQTGFENKVIERKPW